MLTNNKPVETLVTLNYTTAGCIYQYFAIKKKNTYVYTFSNNFHNIFYLIFSFKYIAYCISLFY